MNDKRRRTRVDFQARADVRVVGARLTDLLTRDLSHKGVFVLGKLPLDLGQHCTVKIHLDEEYSPEHDLFMEGKVSRITPDGVAIDFDSMDAETYLHLRNLVLLNSPDPEKTESEFAQPAFDSSSEKD